MSYPPGYLALASGLPQNVSPSSRWVSLGFVRLKTSTTSECGSSPVLHSNMLRLQLSSHQVVVHESTKHLCNSARPKYSAESMLNIVPPKPMVRYSYPRVGNIEEKQPRWVSTINSIMYSTYLLKIVHIAKVLSGGGTAQFFMCLLWLMINYLDGGWVAPLLPRRFFNVMGYLLIVTLFIK